VPDVIAFYADELVRQGRTEPVRVLRDAVRLVAGVHQGQADAVSTLHELHAARPELDDLLGHTSALLRGGAREQAGAGGGGHHGGGGGHHGGGHRHRDHDGEGPGFVWEGGPWWGPEYVVIEPDDYDDDERELEGHKRTTTGAVARWPAVVGPYAVAVSRAPVVDPLGALVRDPWMGPAGLGSLYLAEDREAMDWRATAAQEGEPERWWVRCAR